MDKSSAGQENSDQPEAGHDAGPAPLPGGESPASNTSQDGAARFQGSTLPMVMTPRIDRNAFGGETGDTIDAEPNGKGFKFSLFAMASAALHSPLLGGFAVAAYIGALVGAAGTASITHVFTPPETAVHDDGSSALRASVAKLGTDVAGLKSAIDGSAKTSGSQIAKLGERIDRVEKAQAEPNARLAKISEAIERLERRADTTGSIPTAPPPPPKPAAPPILDGWVLRDVVNGTAMVQGRMGILEIAPGDALPGLGRVEAIRRQDGRWVVVTTKGLIVAR